MDKLSWRFYLSYILLILIDVPAFLVVGPPWWVLFIMALALFGSDKIWDLLSLGMNIWALVIAIRNPTDVLPKIFFVCFGLYLIWAAWRLYRIFGADKKKHQKLKQNPEQLQKQGPISPPVSPGPAPMQWSRINLSRVPPDPYNSPEPVSREEFREWYAFHANKPLALTSVDALAIEYAKYLTRRVPHDIGGWTLDYKMFRVLYQADASLRQNIPAGVDLDMYLMKLYDSLREKENAPGATNTEG